MYPGTFMYPFVSTCIRQKIIFISIGCGHRLYHSLPGHKMETDDDDDLVVVAVACEENDDGRGRAGFWIDCRSDHNMGRLLHF